MKKILFIISNLNIGGPQKSLLALCDKINYDKFEVTIAVINPGGSLKPFFNPNINFVEVPEIITALTVPAKKIGTSLFCCLKQNKIKMFICIIKSILKHLFLHKNMNNERQYLWRKFGKGLTRIEGEYDVAFGILGLSTYIVVDCVNAQQKYHWVRSDTRILKRNENIDSIYYRKLTGALAVSKECKNIFIEMYPFMKNRVKCFYNYIPVSFYKKIQVQTALNKEDINYIKILTVCRLDPLKGIDIAINACKILLQKGYNVKWYVLGDGKEKRKIKKEIRKNNLVDKFILLGFHLNTLDYIKDCDVFVHPSKTEGKSNVVDEAIYCNKPIVVTNYKTVKEQVQNRKTGLICDMNALAVAKKIEEILVNKELKKALVKNCMYEKRKDIDANLFFENLLSEEGK